MDDQDQNYAELINLIGTGKNDGNSQQPRPANLLDIEMPPNDILEPHQRNHNRSQVRQLSQQINPRVVQVLRAQQLQESEAVLQQQLNLHDRIPPVREEAMQVEMNALEKILKPSVGPSRTNQPKVVPVPWHDSIYQRLTMPAFHDWYRRNTHAQNAQLVATTGNESGLNTESDIHNQSILQRTPNLRQHRIVRDQDRTSMKLLSSENASYPGQSHSKLLAGFVPGNPMNNRGASIPVHENRSSAQRKSPIRANMPPLSQSMQLVSNPSLGNYSGKHLKGKREAESIISNPNPKKQRAVKIIHKSRRKLAIDRGDPSMTERNIGTIRPAVNNGKRPSDFSVKTRETAFDDAVNFVKELVDIDGEQQLMHTPEISVENSPEESSQPFLEGRAVKVIAEKNMAKYGIKGEVSKDMVELVSQACRERVSYLLENASEMAKVRVSSPKIGKFESRDDEKNYVPRTLEKMEAEEQMILVAASKARASKWRKEQEESNSKPSIDNKPKERLTKAEKKKKLKEAEIEAKKVRSQNSALSALLSGIVVKKNKTNLPPLQLPRTASKNSQVPNPSESNPTGHVIEKGRAGRKSNDGGATIKIEDILAVCASDPRMKYSDLVYEWYARGNLSGPSS